MLIDEIAVFFLSELYRS